MNYLKILVGSLLALFPFYAFGACGLPDGLNEKKQFAFAEKMIEDGLLTSARDYLQCYRASKPQGEFRFVAMKLEGEVLLQMGESYWPQAQILFEEWLQENPNDVEGDFARLQLGKIHFRFDRPQVAEETLSSIPSSSSLYGPARNLMGQALFQRMLRYQDKNASTQASDLAPRISKYHREALQHSLTEKESQISNYQAGYTLYQNKQFNEALPFWENYLESAEPSKETEDIRYRVATIHQSQKNWLQAEQRYGEYSISRLDLPPENRAQATFWWGEVAFQRAAEQLEESSNSGTLDPAFVKEIVPRYEKYLATNDSNYRPLAAFRLGQLYQSIDQPQQAVTAYQRYLKTKDDAFQQEAHYELGMLYARQNEPKLALEQLLPLRSQERYRTEPGFWTMLVQQYDAIGNKQNAEQILRDAYNNDSFQRNTQLRFLQELSNRQYDEKRCLELLSELAPISDSSSIPEAKRLIWQRGSCFLQEKQWGLARTDFETLLEEPEYRESSFRGMLVANQQMRDTTAQLALFEWASNQPEANIRDKDWEAWLEKQQFEENWMLLDQAYTKELPVPMGRDSQSRLPLIGVSEILEIHKQKYPKLPQVNTRTTNDNIFLNKPVASEKVPTEAIFDRKYPPMLFESTNSSKNTLEKSSTVEDITPPRITILSPTNAFRAIKPLVRGKVLYVRGKAFDDSGVFEVLVNNKDAPLNALGEFESEVRMAVGENLITVSAEDLKGNKSTKSFTVLRESASLKKTTPGTLQPISLKGNYYALLLAVNDYQHTSMLDLKNPINDARRLKAVLSKKYGFKNIELIENPDRPKLISSLEHLRSRITDKDSLLVFFAGHGYWDEEIEQGYWLPSNAERDNPVEWVSNGTLRDYLRGIKSRHTLLISDACFSGGILNTRSVINLAGPGYQELNKLRSRKAMTSGTLNEVPDRSIFIDYLIQRLDQNEEPLLSSYQLFSSLRLAVINNSPTRQVPQYGDIQQAGDEGGDFIFIKSTEEIVSESQTKQAAFKSEVGTQQKEHSNQKTPEVTVFDEDRLVRQWMEWQEQMQQEFENTQALSKKSVDSSKKVEAWRLFLSNWARENPYSKLDNVLRSDAESQKNYWAEPKIEEVAERPVLYKKESGKMALDELVSKRECIGCDLSDIDLSGLNLGGVNLLEAKLIYTKMRDTYLKQSNLSMANMTYADLSRANLSEANLNNATLWFTNLRGATLKNANLREADLSEADLSSANLVGADLRETNLRETNLSYSYLTGANLTGANLTGARFCKTMMPNGSINNEDC